MLVKIRYTHGRHPSGEKLINVEVRITDAELEKMTDAEIVELMHRKIDTAMEVGDVRKL